MIPPTSLGGVAELGADSNNDAADAKPISTAPPPGDMLQFLDGSSLHGKLQLISTNQGVEWLDSDARSSIRFKPAHIGWIRFENPKSVTAQAKPNCRFRFNNGDEVFGALSSLNEQAVELQTWFGGALTTPRHALQTVTFLSKGFSMLYEGPSSGEGWVPGRTPRSWEYRDGSFVANAAGTLGRDLKLTGSSSFSFDLAWNGQFSLILALYTPVLDRFDYSSSSYMFYLSPGYITLQRVQGGAGAVNLGQAQIPEMLKKNKLRLEFRANKADATLGLLVDDRLVQRWKDSSGFVGQGSGVVFFAQLDGPSIRISNIKAAQWEGEFGLEPATNAPAKDDLIYLINRDKVNGTLQKLHDGTLTVTTPQTPLDIPLSRVSQINLGPPRTNSTPAGPWDLRSYFAGGGTVAFTLGDWKSGRVSGQSENFGRVDFDSAFIRQLRFNLDHSKFGSEEGDSFEQDDWDLDAPATNAEPASSLSAAGPRQALVFHNGDLLYGLLDSITPATGVRWRHPDVDQLIEFKPETLDEIRFPARLSQDPNPLRTCRLQLSNGDELEGTIASFDAEKAVLRTSYAGEITIPHNRIRAVTPIPPEGALVFQGPTGLEGWTIGKVVSALGDAGEWKYNRGAFYATNAASIARNVNLPDVAKVEFDLAWKGIFQLALALYTDYFQPINLANKDSEPDFGGFYSLQLNSFSANVLPVKKNDPLRYLGQVSVPAFNQKNSAHVEIRVSKPKRSISLLVDGQLIKQWVENEEFVGQGKGVRFVHQGQGKVRFTNFRVSEWDGQFEEKSPVSTESKLDIAKLRNGDKVAGTVDSILEGKLSIAANGTKLEIPMSRVKQIEMAGKRLERPTSDRRDVRAVFYPGGAVTFQLEKWEQGKVLGSSSNFGHLSFDAAAFARVELNFQSSFSQANP